MPKLTKVLSTSIKKLKLITKILRFGLNDSLTAFNVSPPCVDARPIKGMRAVYMDTGNDSEPIIVGYINNNSKSNEGEIRLYSLNADGEEQNYIIITNKGVIEIGGSTDYMVRFSELKEAYDQLKNDHNNLVTAFNTHTHLTAGTGTPVPPTPGTGIPAEPSAGDISGARIDKIRTS